MAATHTLEARSVPILDKRIATLNRRAAKIGCPPITYTVLREWTDHKPIDDAGIIPGRRPVTMIEVAVAGDPPVLNGWEFVAALEHTDAGNIVRNAPGRLALADYRTVGPNCDHCKVARYRRDTYVVRNTTTGEHRQVGSTCLRDFLGHTDPIAAVRWFELLDSLAADLDGPDADWTGGRVEYRVDLTGYLTCVAAAVRVHGWVSRSKAWETGATATATIASELYHQPAKAIQHDPDLRPTDADVETAESTIDHVRSLDASNDYLHNLLVAFNRSDGLEGRDLGLAASGIAVYRRHLSDQMAATTSSVRVAVPVTDERVHVTGQVIKVDVAENAYGTRDVMTVATDAGYRLWGTTPRALWGVKVGDRVEFMARITRSNRDETFGFYNNPTKARSLAAV